MSLVLGDALIRPIEARDDQAVGQIIRQVGQEFGACGEGFGPSDSEVAAMSRHYPIDQGALYLVAEVDGVLVGGAGVAEFDSQRQICELRKLFLLPQARGRGLGRVLSEVCLEFAVSVGYQQCYLDTLSTMTAAIQLYHSLGFIPLAEPLPGTPHSGCDIWMLKTL